MEHLLNSVVRVERNTFEVVDGTPVMDYVQATDEDDNLSDMLKYLHCRLDLNFLRQGKDVLPAPVAGRAQDRVGVMFASVYAPLRAGDHVVAIENDEGKIPVPGRFEIRAIPDVAQGYSEGDHIEVQIVEVRQELTPGNWPAEEPEDAEQDSAPPLNFEEELPE